MAKQIKAIKCPQCGSGKNVCIKDERYRCGSCGTEYFLDSDDVNVNVNHRVDQPQFDMARGIKIAAAAVGGFVVVASLFIFIGVSSPSRRDSSAREQERARTYRESSHREVRLLPGADGEAVLFYVAQRDSYSQQQQREWYAVFRNPETMKVLKAYKLPITKEDGIDYRYFPSTKKHYLSVNEQLLYELHPGTYNIEDVKETIFRNQEEFASGIASVEFIYEGNGEGFIAVTNMGKEYYYCPGPDKLYTSTEYNNQDDGLDTLLPGAVEKSLYLFTVKSFDYPDEELQLMKIMYMYNNGGPASMTHEVKWVSSGWDGNRRIQKKRLNLDNRFVSYRDLTPERFYIKPKVLYGDDAHVLIRCNPTAAPEAVPSIQLLDAEGELLWTLTGIYIVYWDHHDTVLKTDKYLWMCIDDGYNNRENMKFLRVKLDGSDPKTFEMPTQFKR